MKTVLLKWMVISVIGLSLVGCGDSSKAKDNRQIGEASTTFHLLTPNDKIHTPKNVVENH